MKLQVVMFVASLMFVGRPIAATVRPAGSTPEGPLQIGHIERRAWQHGTLSVDAEVETGSGMGTGNRSARLTISWRRHEQRFSMSTHLPPGWWANPGETARVQPALMLWLPAGHPVLVVVSMRESGTWEIRSPILYVLNGRRWTLATRDPEPYSFTNRGGFYTHRNRLFVWDIAYDERYAHWAPMRFRLKQYRWEDGRLRLAHFRLTKRRYQPDGGGGLPFCTVKAKTDPLREFGLRWLTWGTATAVRAR